MIDNINLRLSPRDASDEKILRIKCATALHIQTDEINDIRIIKRSIDARKKDIIINVSVDVAYRDDNSAVPCHKDVVFKHVSGNSATVVIVGAGPAGLFAALRCIEHNLRPIVLERGKDVDSRRIDITNLNRTGIVDKDSNYCFGEGGAGTFSDGKLFTRSKKRGDNKTVMELLVQFGADEKILCDSHPHIGSDRLPHIMKAIRNKIIECGGEVRFQTRVESLIIEDYTGTYDNEGEKDLKIVKGVSLNNGCKVYGTVILATGHSARDTLRNLHEQGVDMETKGFAMGVRLEHPATLIDKIQYHDPEGRGEYLPAAEYNFVTQAGGRGVYSFCMCPGGVVVPAVSGPGESVVNGMSASARSGRWSNSGMVVEIRPDDFPEYSKYGVFRLMHLQEDLEKKFFKAAGDSIKAPAQRMTDFVNGHYSESLPASSYAPGLVAARVDKLLPDFISERLKAGFKEFGRKSQGFMSNEATVIGLESRTSSPVRIPRDKDTLCHIQFKGLYPAGEGAGYAGGIVSAAIDGMRCADEIALLTKKS